MKNMSITVRRTTQKRQGIHEEKHEYNSKNDNMKKMSKTEEDEQNTLSQGSLLEFFTILNSSLYCV